MKKSKLILVSLLGTVILFAACSKDDDEKTTLQRIQAKWTLDKITVDQFDAGTHSYDTLHGASGDYVDFRTDNKVYSRITIPGFGVSEDTSSYSLLGDTKILQWDDATPLDKDTTLIETLTDNSMTGSQTEDLGGGDYDQSRFYLIK